MFFLKEKQSIFFILDVFLSIVVIKNIKKNGVRMVKAIMNYTCGFERPQSKYNWRLQALNSSIQNNTYWL